MRWLLDSVLDILNTKASSFLSRFRAKSARYWIIKTHVIMWIWSQSLVRTFCSYRLHVNKCVSPRVRRTNCSVFASTVNICKEVEHFVLCSFQHPAPAPSPSPALLLVTGWWDETRALDSRAVEQQAEDAGRGVPRMQRARRRCSGPGPGPSLGTPARGSSGGLGAGRAGTQFPGTGECLPSE